MSGSTPVAPGSPFQAVPRDKRLDNLATWGLQAAAALAFSVGAWQFNSLTNEVRGLRTDMNAIASRVTVMESERLRERQDKLEDRLRIVELKVK